MKNAKWIWIVVVAVIVIAGVSLWQGSGRKDGAATSSPTASATTSHPNSPEPMSDAEPPSDIDVKDSLSKKITFEKGASVGITGFEALTSQAAGPGEISAPAIRITIELTAGEDPIDLGAVVVNSYYGKDLIPADVVARPGGVPFEGVLAAGAKKKAVYVFNIPLDQRDNVTIEFIHPGDIEPIQWQGSVK